MKGINVHRLAMDFDTLKHAVKNLKLQDCKVFCSENNASLIIECLTISDLELQYITNLLSEYRYNIKYANTLVIVFTNPDY